MMFEGVEVYRITYGEDVHLTYEGDEYTNLEEAKAAIMKLAQNDKDHGCKWWACTWRRIEKYNPRFGKIWDDEAWEKVWGDDDFEEVFPKF